MTSILKGRIRQDETKVFDLGVEDLNLSFDDLAAVKQFKLLNCRNVHALESFLTDSNFIKHLNNIDDVLVHVQVEEKITTDICYLKALKKICDKSFDIKNIAIIQLEFEGTERKIISILDEERETFDILSFGEACRHQTFVQLLKDIQFNGDLMSCEIEVEVFLKYFSVSDRPTLALLEYFKFQNQLEVEQEMVKVLITKGTVERCENFIKEHLDRAEEILSTFDTEGFCFNSFAVVFGKVDILKYLITLNFDVLNQASSDLAWKHEKYENLLLLINNDAPFPNEFNLRNIKDSKYQRELKLVVRSREELHDAIAESNLGVAKEFINNYPEVRIGYNELNSQALTESLSRAIESNNFEIYAFLLAKGMIDDNDVQYAKLLRQMTDDQKEKVTNEMKNHFRKHKKSHIRYLMSRSQFAFDRNDDETDRNDERVQKYFERLDQIEEIEPLLRVVENVPLTIIFDFKSPAVHKMLLHLNESTKGICYYRKARIYVGAKNDFPAESPEFDEQNKKIAGTLIHELTHFAMEILFKNGCKPFDSFDIFNQEKFMEIVNAHEGKENHPIVKLVYDFYGKFLWPTELIVRVPHILASSEISEGRNVLTTNYLDLYSYYNDVVLKRANELLADPKQFHDNRKIQEFNLHFYVDEVLHKDFWLNSEETRFHLGEGLNIIKSNSPHLVMTELYQKYHKFKNAHEITSPHLFVSLKHLQNNMNWEKVCWMWRSNASINLVINCEKNFEETADEPWLALNDEKLATKMILVCESHKKLEMVKRMLSKVNLFNVRKIDYKFNDLEETSKQKLLQTKTRFQGELINFVNLVSQPSERIISALPLNEFVNGSIIAVGQPIEVDNFDQNYYIERTLKLRVANVSSRDFSTENLERLLKKANDDKFVIISDNAGMGKSTILDRLVLNLKAAAPDKWIIKINLQRYVNLFNSSEFSRLTTADEAKKAFFEHFAKHSNQSTSASRFEEEIFYESLVNEKILIMFDGFDEINPFCDVNVLKFIELIFNSRRPQIWITTRSHLTQNLESRFGVRSLELNSFSVFSLMRNTFRL